MYSWGDWWFYGRIDEDWCNPTPNTWMQQNHHPSGKCTGILPLTHECSMIITPQEKCTEILPLTHKCNRHPSSEIVIPQVNAPESYPSHMNARKSSLIRSTNRKPTPHTWMHHNHPPSSKRTGILPLTHECTEIVTPQVNATESYPSHMNATKSSFLDLQHRNLAPHIWMHRNHHPSSKCTDILPLTHECTEIVIPQVNAPESYPSHMNAPKSSILR